MKRLELRKNLLQPNSTNFETHKTNRNPPITNHKPWPFVWEVREDVRARKHRSSDFDWRSRKTQNPKTILTLQAASVLWKWRNDRHSERNLCNCVKKPENKNNKNSGLQGLEPVISRLQVRCSTNWAMKPLTLGAVNCGFILSRERNEC